MPTLTQGQSASNARQMRRLAAASTILFGVAILWSAFLLFLVEPLSSKLILPSFGGSSAVWIVCLLFFQIGLLLGYSYAHLSVKFLRTGWQVGVHYALLALSLAWLPILPGSRWIPKPGEDPTWLVLGVLATSVGLPYALLSATSPLLQTWYAGTTGAVLPYRYFALSNAGSLAALLLYPILIESRLTTREQAWSWSVGFAVFAVLCAATASFARKVERPGAYRTEARSEPLRWRSRLLWLALSACPSALLLSVTTLLTENIAPMPLLWILPLAIYLLTFVLCFASTRWYERPLMLALVLPALGCLATAAGPLSNGALAIVIPLCLTALFVCCMACHGELARLKPDAPHLTVFYLWLAAGGVLGGLLVALIAPHIFSALYEYPLTLFSCAVLLLLVTVLQRNEWTTSNLAWSAWLAGAAGAVVLAGYLSVNTWHDVRAAVLMGRNFYGALRVDELRDPLGRRIRQMNHGTITHGIQYLAPGLRGRATTYYATNSGVGLAWRILERSGPLRMGVVGLGAGTLATYGRAGDSLTFYDINPLVLDIARTEFTFLADCPAHVDVLLGDARLTMSRQPDQHFDLLVVDAFSGDAIPLHLLTREALQIYFRHLKDDGVLAVHVSNRYLDLAPILAMGVQGTNETIWQVENDDDDAQEIFGSSWVLVSKRRGFFDHPLLKGRLDRIDVPGGLRTWTDNYSNLYQVLRFGSED